MAIRALCSAAAAVAVSSGTAFAAVSFSNDLTSEAGLSPNLEVSDTVDANRVVTFDGLGAHFGSGAGGNDGRNYIRTTDTDYATTDFVAEVTADFTSGGRVFIGLGGGTIGAFGTPDWDNTDSIWLEIAPGGLSNYFTFNDGPDGPLGAGLTATGQQIRLRMTWDASMSAITFEIDNDYAGGPFAADLSSGALTTIGARDLSTLFTGAEPSSIFFGNGDGLTLRDAVVTVVPAPAGAGLLAMGGLVAIRRRR